MYGFQQESEDYRKAREALREAEIALRDQRERVAALRRALPQDTAVEDYVLIEGPRDLEAGDEPLSEVRLSGLFEDHDKPLLLMHFMFGKKQAHVCPMCAMWADGYNAVQGHLRQRMNFAVAVAGDLAAFRGIARDRGWHDLRLVSTQTSTLKRDLGVEAADGGQDSAASVFTLGPDGTPRHFYSGGANLAETEWRGLDLLSPVWHFLDLMPDGRDDWMPA